MVSEDLAVDVNEGPTAAQVSAAGHEPTAGARARHAELSAEIEEHQYRYYVLESPTASDAEYDVLMHELMRIEDEFPSLRTPSSPSQRVGGDFATTMPSVAHAEQMLSLDNVFSIA